MGNWQKGHQGFTTDRSGQTKVPTAGQATASPANGSLPKDIPYEGGDLNPDAVDNVKKLLDTAFARAGCHPEARGLFARQYAMMGDSIMKAKDALRQGDRATAISTIENTAHEADKSFEGTNNPDLREALAALHRAAEQSKDL